MLFKEILIKIYEFITHRLFLLMLFFILLFWILILRLFNLQIIEGDKHLREFKSKIYKEVTVDGTRGNIYDKYGRPVATNDYAFSIILEDSVQVKDKNGMLAELIKIIDENNDSIINNFLISYTKEKGFFYNETSERRIERFKKNIFKLEGSEQLSNKQKAMKADKLYEYIKSEKLFDIDNKYEIDMTLKIMALRYEMFMIRFTKYEPIKIAVNVSEQTIARIKERQNVFPSIVIETEPIRVYPYSELFAHILGYTGRITEDQFEVLKNAKGKKYDQFDIVGRTGIEKEMEIYLKGLDGKKSFEVDNTGRRMNVIETQNPTKGNNIVLTIDKDFQKKTSEILYNKIRDIILSRLVVDSNPNPNPKKKEISLSQVFNGLLNNNFISLNGIENNDGYYQKLLKGIYDNQANKITGQLEKLLLSNTTVIKYYGELYEGFYNELIQSMINSGKLSTAYRGNNYSKFYTVYKNGGKTAKQFMVFAIENDFINMDLYEKDFYLQVVKELIDEKLINITYQSGNINVNSVYLEYTKGEKTPKQFLDYCLRLNDDKVLKLDDYKSKLESKFSIEQKASNILTTELQQASKSNKFKKNIYNYLIERKFISHRNMLLLMFEQGIISEDETPINDIKSGKLKTIDVIRTKILNGEITPQNLALDPSTGSVVVVDVNTGEVLSLVSYPSYNNNKLVNSFDRDYYKKLNEDKTIPLYFRAIKEYTAPGSTFKMISAMTALEENVITIDEKINALGKFLKIGRPYPKCWYYPSHHGPINVIQALEVSCNYFFYEVAYRLSTSNDNYLGPKGIYAIKKYAEKFGLDSESGIELDELPPKISEKDPVRTAIGQAENAYTPVHLARYTATLANGGTNYKLSIVDKVLDPDGEVREDKKPIIVEQNNFKQENLQAVKEGTLKVTSGSKGSVRAVFKDSPIKVGGKTGTAQEGKRDEHALFVGYAPYDEPLIAVSVVLPFGYSSAYPAEICRDVVNAYFEVNEPKKESTLDNEFIQ